jgi:hypothetical protein
MAYFRQAVKDPASVQPWSEWWKANVELVERTFPLVDYVRLKHRRLRGAREILKYAGELPQDYVPPSPVVTGTCTECGERTASDGEGGVKCPVCGVVYRPTPASA